MYIHTWYHKKLEKANNLEKLYKTKEAAEILGISVGWLRDNRDTYGIRYIKLGRQLRFPESAIEELAGKIHDTAE